MEEEIKGVKLSEEQQAKLLEKYKTIIEEYKGISDFVNALNANKLKCYMIYMTDDIFNFVYNLYRSDKSNYNNLLNKYTFTYNSFIENIDTIVDDNDNNSLDDFKFIRRTLNIWVIFDFLFKKRGQLSLVNEISEKICEYCLRKGLKNVPKDNGYLYLLDNYTIYALGASDGIVSTYKTATPQKIPENEKANYLNFNNLYCKLISAQRTNYFSNINNAISLYNIIKDNKQLLQIFNKLEDLQFKKQTKNTDYGIRHTFVRPVKNKKGEFIAFYTICFIENKEYQDIRIEPYVFMPNISINNSKISEKFEKLSNQKSLSRFETLNLLVNYNLLLLINDECNLNMTKTNMDIDKISLWFGSRDNHESTFIDLLTDYNKPLYSFQTMDNILTNEALNVLGNGNQELMNTLIKDSLVYFKLENQKQSYADEIVFKEAKNNLFSKIKINDDNFLDVIAHIYEYMSDGLISRMSNYTVMNYDDAEYLSNNYVPTKLAIELIIVRYYSHIKTLQSICYNPYENKRNEYINRFYSDKELALELKELVSAFSEAHTQFIRLLNLQSYIPQDYILEQLENYDKIQTMDKMSQALFLWDKSLEERKEFCKVFSEEIKKGNLY